MDGIDQVKPRVPPTGQIGRREAKIQYRCHAEQDKQPDGKRYRKQRTELGPDAGMTMMKRQAERQLPARRMVSAGRLYTPRQASIVALAPIQR